MYDGNQGRCPGKVQPGLKDRNGDTYRYRTDYTYENLQEINGTESKMTGGSHCVTRFVKVPWKLCEALDCIKPQKMVFPCTECHIESQIMQFSAIPFIGDIRNDIIQPPFAA